MDKIDEAIASVNRKMGNRNIGDFICNPIVSVSMPPSTTLPWYLCDDCDRESTSHSAVDDCCPYCGGMCTYLGQRGVLLKDFGK
jgi:hypothetical protein